MERKENENNGIDSTRFRIPSNETKLQSFQKLLYNPSTGEVLGRTGKSWGQLLLFYTIFYIILSILFALCMTGLLYSLNDKEPKWQLESSLIGTNPGLGFRPISNRTEEGSLIRFHNKKNETIERWRDLIEDFLAPYNVNQTGENYEKCDFKQGPRRGNVCQVIPTSFETCGPQNNYGYNVNQSSVCVYLKLNKIFGWKPKPIMKELPEMPESLQKTIRDLEQEERKQVWISCKGEGDFDHEQIRGFKYFPSQGLPDYYFPYMNTPNYLSPLIAVEISADFKSGLMLSIECRAWAENISYRGGDLQREGSIQFEVLIDE